MRPVLCLATVVLLLAGCDVEQRPGTWTPIGANDANLHAMIADPDDLVTGVADNRADGQVIAAAVARYRAGKVKELADSSVSRVAPLATNSSGSSSAASTQ